MADGLGWPRVVVVTDRRRLLRRADAPESAWPGLLAEQIEGALTGGADLVQIREPDLSSRTLVQFLRRLFGRLASGPDRVVINDRADIALVTGAAGVHLTERSLGVEDVRRLWSADKRCVIGRSVHTPEAARLYGEASYLIAGTVLATASKPPGSTLLGWSGLAEIVEAAGRTPVVAIGGLGPGDVPALRRAGATGLAGIECFLPEAGAAIAVSVQERVRAVKKAFDTTGGETYTQIAGG